jgi:hypothetical protein
MGHDGACHVVAAFVSNAGEQKGACYMRLYNGKFRARQRVPFQFTG